MGISFATAKLLDFANQDDVLLASHNPFALITLAHLRTQQAHHDPDKLSAAKIQVTKLLYRHGWSKQRIIVLFDVINWMMALPERYEQRYWQAIRQLEREHKMKWISPMEQSFIDEGFKKGRHQGASSILERQLTERFGPLSQAAQKKLARASEEQLEAWSVAILEAQSLKQVFG